MGITGDGLNKRDNLRMFESNPHKPEVVEQGYQTSRMCLLPFQELIEIISKVLIRSFRSVRVAFLKLLHDDSSRPAVHVLGHVRTHCERTALTTSYTVSDTVLR